MKPAARKGDKCMPKSPCSQPHVAFEGSSNVFVNGKPFHRAGDQWDVTYCPKQYPPKVATSKGSSNVYVNGRPAARVEDEIAPCGAKIAEGSPNVLVGG